MDESKGTQKGDPVTQAYLWSKSGLDGNKDHTLVLNATGMGQYGGGYVEVYGFRHVRPHDISNLQLTSYGM